MTDLDRKPRVLVVDDSRMSRMMVETNLRKRYPGWQILQADNGTDAVSLCLSMPIEFVTMDVNMDGLSGIDAAEKIIPACPGTRIILLTANIQDEVRERAARLEIGFVGKPIKEASLSQIYEFIDGALENV